MSVFDKLSVLQKRFLNDLGIDGDKDIPDSFYEVIENPNLSDGEMYCLSIGNGFSTKFYPSSGNKFHIKDLVGTNHEKYYNKSWIDAFIDLARCDENLEKFYNNSLYYDDENYDYGLKSDNSSVGLIVKNNKLYIFDRNGGGNNRLIIAKIRYLGLMISQCKNEEERKRIEENSWYKGDVRYCPNLELADTILDIEFVNGGYKETGYIVELDKDSPRESPTYSILQSKKNKYPNLMPDEIRLFKDNMYNNVDKSHVNEMVR